MTTTFGGWNIDQELFGYIAKTLPVGGTILELGSGAGTGALVERWNVYSIEENKQYVGLYHNQYIFAPIIDDWYDLEAISRSVPEKYDLMLVDGPAYGTRNNMNAHLDSLRVYSSGCKTFVFDDVHRAPDQLCYETFLRQISTKLTVRSTGRHNTSGGKSFAFISIGDVSL